MEQNLVDRRGHALLSSGFDLGRLKPWLACVFVIMATAASRITKVVARQVLRHFHAAIRSSRFRHCFHAPALLRGCSHCSSPSTASAGRKQRDEKLNTVFRTGLCHNRAFRKTYSPGIRRASVIAHREFGQTRSIAV